MKADLARGRFHWPGLGQGAQIVALILVTGLLVAMAIQPTRQLLQQSERVSDMAGNLEHVERVNERLAERIERLKDPDYIEQRAREQIGLVRPNERTYVVVPPGKGESAGSKSGKPKHRRHVPPPKPGALESFLHFLGLI